MQTIRCGARLAAFALTLSSLTLTGFAQVLGGSGAAEASVDNPATGLPDPATESPVVITLGFPDRTTVIAEIGYQPVLQTIVAIEPTPATIVPLGATLVLRPAAEFGAVTNVAWYHNGTKIADNTPELTLAPTTAADSGYYHATFSGNPAFAGTSPRQFAVVTADRHRLLNLSTRTTVSPSAPNATVGFVVGSPASGSVRGQSYLIRVIGPALSGFNVPQPLADPELHLRRAGSSAEIGMAFAQVVYSDGTTPETRYYDTVRAAAAKVGAFPIALPSPGTPTTPDKAMLISLTAGAYTITANSTSGGSGEVLIEIYEVWTEPTDFDVPTTLTALEPSS